MKTAYVTGASGYWGRKICLSLLRKGWQVVALCRTEPTDLLQWGYSQNHSMLWIPFDLERPDWAVLDTLPEPDACFHAAALFDPDIERMMTVNAVNAIALLARIIARMRARGHGQIGILLGQNGRLGLPGLGGFSATQAALWTWVEAMQRTLRQEKSGVHISLVFPPRAPSALQGQLAAQLAKPPRVKPPGNADRLVCGVLAAKRRVGRKPLLAALAMWAA